MNTKQSTVVIKIGGSTVDAPGLLAELGKSIRQVLEAGSFCVVVHGGGKDIARQLDRLNKKFTFVEGQRVTDAETMQAVQMVLSGDVNKRIVNALLVEHVAAMGTSGVDDGLFEAKKMTVNGQDIGLVGTVAKVNKRIIDMCEKNNIVPVISPVSRDSAGQILNVNADGAASDLAVALGASHLVFISDVDGVLSDGKVMHEIRTADIEKLAQEKIIYGGMVPKLRSAAEAVRNGVGRVHICGWHGVTTLSDELSPQKASGTMVY